MYFSIKQFSSKTSNVKDVIVSVLANEWPLTAKEIFNQLKSRFGLSVSYQAVHKSLNELEKIKIIKKNEKKYSLHSDWIKNVKFFAEDLSEKYYENNKISKNFEESITLKFDNILAVGRFVVHDFVHGNFNPEKKESMCLWNYCWPLIGMNEEDYKALREGMENTTHYSLTRNNTFLDKMFNEMLNKVGKISKSGIDYLGDGDLIIEGDYIFQVFYTPEFKKEWSKIYSEINKENLDLDKIFNELLNKKTEITGIIFKNRQLAEKLRKETLKHFK